MQLTQREREVIRFVREGFSNKEIGAALFISEGTVKVHLHNIFRKLGIDRRMRLLQLDEEALAEPEYA